MYEPRENVLHLKSDGPGAIPVNADQGYLSLRAGRFEEARQIFRGCLRADPTDYRSQIGLCAALDEGGDHYGAATMLRAVARHHPLIPPHRVDPGLPSLLEIRSLEAARYVVTRRSGGDGFKIVLSGGHFSLDALLPRGNVNRYLGNQLRENLDELTDEDGELHLAVNTIACPDTGEEALRALASFLAGRPDLPVVNPPDGILALSRDRLHRRLQWEAGIAAPRTLRLPAGLTADAVQERLVRHGLQYPVLLREALSGTTDRLALIHDRSWLEVWLEQSEGSDFQYLQQFHDVADPAGHVVKWRGFFVDGTFYPAARVVSDTWHVKMGDRYRLMAEHEELRAEERRFLQAPGRALGSGRLAALARLPDLLKLDFFGVDFTIGRDGDVLVLAANPAMPIILDYGDDYPYAK
ncbi:MAG: tetratricopeptide repeat protein, partial [Pseudomonadota bacterium]